MTVVRVPPITWLRQKATSDDFTRNKISNSIYHGDKELLLVKQMELAPSLGKKVKS